MTCLDDGVLARWLNDELSELEEERVCEHLAGCRKCVDQANRLDDRPDDFASALASWTAAAHGAAVARERLMDALHALESRSPDMVQQIQGWRDRVVRGIDISMRTLLDAVERVAAIGAGLAPEAGGLRYEMAPSGVRAGEKTAKAEALKREACGHISEGRLEEARDSLRESVKLDARVPQAAEVHVLQEGHMVAAGTAHSRTPRIDVKAWPRKDGRQPAVAVYLPDAEDGEAVVAPLKPVDGQSYLEAEIKAVQGTGQVFLF